MKKKYNVLRNENNEIVGYQEIPFDSNKENVELSDEEFQQKINEVFNRNRAPKS